MCQLFVAFLQCKICTEKPNKKNISQWKMTKYHLKSITYHFQIQKKQIFDRGL